MRSHRTRLIGHFVAATATASFVALVSPAARAQSNDTVTAEALFQQGKSLLSQNRFSEACPKLAESQRLDPATGTLMALAMCHEGSGQIASAWAEFTDVEGRSRKDGREDRQKLAHDRANALRARLSTLEIHVPPEVSTLDGVVVTRDGLDMGRGVWNTALPIDGGEHVIEASAPGKVSWRGSVTVKVENDRASLKVPPLKAAPAGTTAAVAGTTAASTSGPPSTQDGAEPAQSGAGKASSGGLSATQWIGIAAAGTGVAALGVGGYFLATALGEKSDSNQAGDPDYCDAQGCGDTGQALRHDAVTHGNIATILGVTGGVLVATGATLFIVGGKKTQVQGVLSTVRVGALAAPGAARLELRGSF
ncbi:MAG TPA: hypothetical protein VFV94_10490 [Polyangiaceae bacterium]|jgi:serine/threonine-protein kinase|nr:hypothetical protein [Polyangiaceae bacterium]